MERIKGTKPRSHWEHVIKWVLGKGMARGRPGGKGWVVLNPKVCEKGSQEVDLQMWVGQMAKNLEWKAKVPLPKSRDNRTRFRICPDEAVLTHVSTKERNSFHKPYGVYVANTTAYLSLPLKESMAGTSQHSPFGFQVSGNLLNVDSSFMRFLLLLFFFFNINAAPKWQVNTLFFYRQKKDFPWRHPCKNNTGLQACPSDCQRNRSYFAWFLQVKGKPNPSKTLETDLQITYLLSRFSWPHTAISQNVPPRICRQSFTRLHRSGPKMKWEVYTLLKGLRQTNKMLIYRRGGQDEWRAHGGMLFILYLALSQKGWMNSLAHHKLYPVLSSHVPTSEEGTHSGFTRCWDLLLWATLNPSL